ncbi:hypothetical protein GCM10017620_25740 [Brevundimonas intermedia]|uniref:Zinc finger Ogr/Delta-type domain-containing protein n=1 Tax=Brevundimonas intermedia TaxID=74315 RepID=A0ABQ5TCX8_9CAUL|nr:hypothetical protein GCM10017620_25740 [Brevundimonas intermedia]
MLGMKRYGGRVPCPHCGSASAARSSRGVSPTYRETYLRCSNLECGWVGVASIIIERTVVQSASPNPRVALPVTATRRKAAGAPTPQPANDDQVLAPAEAL